jgi:hypothetical protein
MSDRSYPPDVPEDPYFDASFAAEAFDYAREDDPFQPVRTVSSDLAEPVDLPQSFDPDAGWHWHDGTLIALAHPGPDASQERYAVGAVDVYANALTGDLGGSYLEIGAFDSLDEAADLYASLQADIHDRHLLPFQFMTFAQDKAVERGQSAPEWRGMGEAEYAAYDAVRSLESGDIAQPEQSVSEALRQIGLGADGFDLDADAAPFTDDAGTRYWIGVFQPDPAQPDACVTSILSLGHDPDSGELHAALAPCVPGDWDRSFEAAEYLIDVAGRDGIESALDAAGVLALATDQRELWRSERGIPLGPDAASDLAQFAHEEQEIDL